MNRTTLRTTLVAALCAVPDNLVHAIGSMLPVTFLVLSALAAPGFAAAPSGSTLRSFLTSHCLDCHDGETRKGGLDLTTLSTEFSSANLMAKWVRIHDRVAAGEMPPEANASSQWSNARHDFLHLLSNSLTEADKANREVVIRRLTRVEYENTLHDLLGVKTPIQTLLPEDGRAHGFDKVSDGLSLSSTHLQRYIDGARLALHDAVHKGPRPTTKRETVEVSVGVVMPKELERARVPLPDGSLVFFGDGGFPTYMVPCDTSVEGRYRFRLTGRAYQSTESIGFKLAAGGFTRGKTWRDLGVYSLPPEGGKLDIEVWMYAGEKLRIFPYVGNGFQMWRFQNKNKPSVEYPGPGLSIQPVEYEGPLIDEWPGRGHQLLFANLESKLIRFGSQNLVPGQFSPKGKSPQAPGQFDGKGQFRQKQNNYMVAAENPRDEANRLIEAFLPVAFRRPTTTGTAAIYLKLVHDELDTGASFEEALLTAYTAALCAPEFLYLRENPGKLDPYALAARLSYFLWSSAPDAELIALAKSGELSEPKTLRTQTERLLADPKGQRLTENFTGQWLSLREIDLTTPDPQLYPEFDAELQFAMLGETRGFFDKLLKENLNVSLFVDSDWTLVNERLAKHYGVEGVEGSDFRVAALLPEHHRGGVLAHASVLKVTANGALTSPIKRGSWVLSRILGITPPPPPPGVPGVEPDTRGATTLRQQLDKHRTLESCNACHRSIDPPGFALENYDVIGGWREAYRILAVAPSQNSQNQAARKKQPQWKPGPPVDATGVTPEGQPFQNLAEYKRLLLARPERFTRALTEQLAVYATGRGMGFSDRPELDRIASDVFHKGNGLRDLVHEIVQSELFQTK